MNYKPKSAQISPDHPRSAQIGPDQPRSAQISTDQPRPRISDEFEAFLLQIQTYMYRYR